MLDSICVQYSIEIAKEFISTWGYEKKLTKRGYSAIYRLVVTTRNGCGVTYRYIPRTPKGNPLLQVEFSLPHLVFNNNTNLICNFEWAIDQAMCMLPDVPGIPQLDLRVGLLNRLDICYNFQVGRLVPYYIQALKSLKYPRRHTIPYSDQGVQYGNNQVASKFYDKERWCIDKKVPDIQYAKGILRFEITLRKNAIKRLTGKQYPTLRDITIELTLDALEKELSGLGLLDRSIGTYDTALAKLCEIYGTDAGFCYFGALAAGIEYPSRVTVIAASGIHPRTLDRRLKKVVDANHPLTLTTYEESLPPLTIDRDLIIEMVNHGASVMKYQVIPKDLQNSVGVTPENNI